ncbi:MAG TPA: hypothetical protein VE594_07425 [Nitrososphaeraceae archaeon]|nr:hypothetical protein [Nitrososphaeraceae archaeon]
MKKNNILCAVVFALLLLVTTIASTYIYAQEDENDIDSDNEITSQIGPEVLANESVPFSNQSGSNLTNSIEPGAEGSDNFTTSLGNESLPAEEESFDTGNESLLSEQDQVENDFENETIATDTETTPIDNTTESSLEDDGNVISQSQQGVTPDVDEKLETVAAATLGLTNASAGPENEQMTNVQQVINNIAIASSQGGDINVIVNQISQLVANNPNSPTAIAIKKLAQLYSNGDIDEIDVGVHQIGTQIAQGNNIEQTIVQITNNIENNIKNVKIDIDNFDKIIVHPNTLDIDKKIITETITTIKKSKSVVDVPRIHIRFDGDEKNLVLRVLNTNDAKYEMPFSKNKGGFKLDADEFRVKVIGGKGKIQTASMAQMLGDGKIGEKEFLDKDRKNGNVYFNTDEIDSGKYLLEIYIKLSDGSIGTWARGSVTITN